MKKSIILLLLNLLIVTVCFSQTTYPSILNDSLIVITPQQLKQTNLLFLDRERLIRENSELKFQLDNYSFLLDNYKYTDTIKSEQINLLKINLEDYNSIINSQSTKINKLNKSNKLLRGISIGGVVVSVSLIVLLCLK